MLQNVHKCRTPCSVIQKWRSLFFSNLSFVGKNLTAKRKIFIWWHVVLYATKKIFTKAAHFWKI